MTTQPTTVLAYAGKDRADSLDETKAEVSHFDLAPARPMPDTIANLSEEEMRRVERRLVRKVDLVLLPIVGILYILNYIDRQNLAVAKLQGVMEDFNLSTEQFATAISILFVGYIPFQIPSNLIITRVARPGLYICSAVVLWGAVSACTAAVQNYSSLLAVRVLLGITEAVFFSGVVYFLSAWYTKAELGKRLAGLFVAQQLGNAFGGLIAAGVLKLDGAHGIRGWRWLFIVEGVATVGCGIISAFIMPEYPHNARILNQTERDLAVWRLEQEAGAAEAHDDTGTLKGFTMALKDPKIYVFIFMQKMAQAAGTVTNYFPSIVQTLGYNKTLTLLLTAPPYIFAGMFFMVVTYYSDRTGKIYLPIMGCIALSLAMYIVPMVTLNTGGRYFAMMLMPASAVTPQILLFKMLNLHCPRPIAKRAAGVALMNSIANVSNIWSSFLYYSPPHYYAAFGTMCAVVIAFAIVVSLYGMYVRRENRRLNAGGAEAAKAMKYGVTQEQVDLHWCYVGF